MRHKISLCEEWIITDTVLKILQGWADENLVRTGRKTPFAPIKRETCLGYVPTDQASWPELNLAISEGLPGIAAIGEDMMRQWKNAGDVIGSVLAAVQEMPREHLEWFGTFSRPQSSQEPSGCF